MRYQFEVACALTKLMKTDGLGGILGLGRSQCVPLSFANYAIEVANHVANHFAEGINRILSGSACR